MNAKEYLEMASRRKGTDSSAFDLVMPSGAVWRVLPISLQAYILSGRLPLHLISGLSSMKNLEAQAAKLTEKMTGADVINMYSIVRDVMLSNVLEPKISLDPGEDTLLPEQIIPEDFEYFTQFVFNGGQAAQNSFRKPADGNGAAATGPAPDTGTNGADDIQVTEPDTFS